MALSACPQGLGRTVSLESQLIKYGHGCSCFFPSFPETPLSSTTLANVRIGRLFSQKMEDTGEEREGGKSDLLSNLDASLTTSSPCSICGHACEGQ